MIVRCKIENSTIVYFFMTGWTTRVILCQTLFAQSVKLTVHIDNYNR